MSYTDRKPQRRDITMFKKLIVSPAAASAKLPANGRFAVMRNTAATSGTLALSVVGSKNRNIAVPDLKSGEYYVIDSLERGAVVSVQNGFTLYADTGMSKWKRLVGPDYTVTRIAELLTPYGGSVWTFEPATVSLNTDGSGDVTAGTQFAYVKDALGIRAATQASAASQPRLQLVGGKWAAIFDGVDDAISTQAQASVGSETFIAAVVLPTPTGSSQHVLSRRSTVTNLGSALWLNGAASQPGFVGAGTSAIGPTPAVGSACVLSGRGLVGQVNVRTNGVQGAGVAYASYSSQADKITIGNSTDLQRPFKGAVFAVAYAPTIIPDAVLLEIERLMGSLAGAKF